MNCKIDSDRTELIMSSGDPGQNAVEVCCIVRAVYSALEAAEREKFREMVQTVLTEENGFWSAAERK